MRPWGILLFVMPLACAGELVAPETSCPDGFVKATGGGCDPVLPAGPCPVGSMARLGSEVCSEVGVHDCAAGFEAHPSGVGCRAIIATGPCAAGSRPAVGAAGCVAAGWSQCPARLDPDPSGWGCIDRTTSADCPGATRAAFGVAACVPLGDCAAPFPPAGATRFVDASFTPGQLDATHHITVAAALAAAAPGETIAIESGTYAESLSVGQDVTIAGRCAEQVIIDGAAANTLGVDVAGAVTLSLSGVTLRGHRGAVGVFAGATVTMREVVIADNREVGLSLGDAGSALTLVQSVVRGTVADAGGDFGWGVDVEEGARVSLSDVTLDRNVGSALVAVGTGTQADLRRVVIRGAAANPASSFAVWVEQGASLAAVDSSWIDNPLLGVLVSGDATRASLRDCVVREGTHDATGEFGVGIQVDRGGYLELSGVAVSNNQAIGLTVADPGSAAILEDVVIRATQERTVGSRGNGINIQSGGAVSATGCAVVGNREIGVIVEGDGSVAELSDCVVAGTRPASVTGFGNGVAAFAGGRVVLSDSAVLDNREAGVAASGAASTLELAGSVVEATELDPALAALARPQGVLAEGGGAVTIEGSVVRDNRRLGVYAWSGTTEPRSEVGLTRSAVVDNRLSHDGLQGAGVFAGPNGRVVITESDVRRNPLTALLVNDAGAIAQVAASTLEGSFVDRVGHFGRGLTVQGAAVAVVTDSLIYDNAGLSVFASGGRVSLTRTAVYSRVGRADPVEPVAIEIIDGASASLIDVAVAAPLEIGLHVVDGAVNAERLVVRGAESASDGSWGHGVFGWQRLNIGAPEITVRASVVEGSAGIGVVFAAAAAVVESTHIRDNLVGIHVQEAELREVEVPSAPETAVVQVTGDTVFSSNATRVGSGAVPLPEVRDE